MIVIGIDILTTCESCASVNDFRVTNGTYCTNNFTYQSNCYSMCHDLKEILRVTNFLLYLSNMIATIVAQELRF